ncbi:DUF3788 domain-containing protein [Maribacter halichondriae]|uniref:DUF3788 domain-containing protein n=1 Tax=Maribacter halichondriae TaxID=2980554 RepID=UPI002358F9E8|nr:DUF3788 domain-containing protein [Maribacter sp. Hal144]
MRLKSNPSVSYQRLLNKGFKPTNQDILGTIGDKSDLWLQLHQFIEDNYDFKKELAFYSKNYGWTVRYRKSKKTLVSCFPEKGAFSVLLVLGKKEANKVELVRDELNENFLSVFDETEQLHDGRWLWIRILTQQDLDALIKVIQIKKRIRK